MTTRLADRGPAPGPVGPRAAPTAPVRVVEPRNPPGSLVWEVPMAVAVGGLGLWLGVVNQGAAETAQTLRVPALLTALVMVGQAVLTIARIARGVQPVGRRVNPAVPAALIGLAAWLGAANLRVVAPELLTQLSLAAAFVLFALGWWLLGDRT